MDNWRIESMQMVNTLSGFKKLRGFEIGPKEWGSTHQSVAFPVYSTIVPVIHRPFAEIRRCQRPNKTNLNGRSIEVITFQWEYIFVLGYRPQCLEWTEECLTTYERAHIWIWMNVNCLIMPRSGNDLNQVSNGTLRGETANIYLSNTILVQIVLQHFHDYISATPCRLVNDCPRWMQIDVWGQVKLCGINRGWNAQGNKTDLSASFILKVTVLRRVEKTEHTYPSVKETSLAVWSRKKVTARETLACDRRTRSVSWRRFRFSCYILYFS